MTKRLFQALMLIAMLGLVLPATAEATSITLPSMTFNPGTGQTDSTKDPGNYEFRLTFDTVINSFTVNVTAEDSPTLTGLPLGYICVPISGGTNCILFKVTTSAVKGIDWDGQFQVFISWSFDTNTAYANSPVDQNNLGRIRIVHFSSSSGINDVTTTGSYCSFGPGCVVDPGIGGQADNFSDFIVAQAPSTAPVPEPTSLLLLGSGVAALLIRLRQRGLKSARS